MADDARLVEAGLWVERIGARSFPEGSPALFLDRDGTLNVDTGYVGDPRDVVLIDAMVPAVAAANARGWPVVVVTNQSGVARGYFGWDAFAAVNRRVLDLMAGRGAAVDLVLACAYHEAGQGALGVPDHPMRKPLPGMLLLAAEMLGTDRRESIMVGDKAADMQAAKAAGLRSGRLIGDDPWDDPSFPVGRLASAADYRALAEEISSARSPRAARP